MYPPSGQFCRFRHRFRPRFVEGPTRFADRSPARSLLELLYFLAEMLGDNRDAPLPRKLQFFSTIIRRSTKRRTFSVRDTFIFLTKEGKKRLGQNRSSSFVSKSCQSRNRQWKSDEDQENTSCELPHYYQTCPLRRWNVISVAQSRYCREAKVASI